NLYLLTFVVALVSGILLILRRLVWVSISGVIFTLTCGVLSGPIAAYLAWIAFSGRGFWQVFGYILGSPLIVLSVISLFVVVLGFRKANKLRIIG
ncbi:MAG: hypothetical protein QM398_12305, partial [Thermoproteota archaeon]|nr:hypothetical protein [Thermoproteota archaeon]